MPDNKFDLGDYVEVKDRIKLFYELFGQGRLVTADVRLITPEDLDGKPRVMVKALAYRSPDDPHPGVGYSWLEVPGATPYTKGSEIENAETSAWGRAIGSLGILIDRSIASANEIENKRDGGAAVPTPPPAPAKLPTNGDGSLIGTAELAKDFPDFLPKQTPDGMALAFKLVSPAGGIKVIATGDLASVLPTIRESVIGQRVSCWGRVRDETFRPKGSKRDVTYQVLDLERIKTSLGTLPAVSVASQEPVEEPPDDVELVGEAPTEPMFDDVPVAS